MNMFNLFMKADEGKAEFGSFGKQMPSSVLMLIVFATGHLVQFNIPSL